MHDTSHKRCRKCGIERAQTDFYVGRNACKPCERQRAKDYAARHPEKLKAKSARRDKQKQRDAAKAWAKKNQDRKRASKRAWRAANPEKVKAMKRRDYERHREAYIARAAKQPKDPEKRREHGKAWRKRRPEKGRFYAKARSGLKRARATVPFKHSEWLIKVAEYDWRCAYCFVLLNEPTMDHVVPLRRDGLHELSNIVPACRSCNSQKGARLPHEWLAGIRVSRRELVATVRRH